MKTIITTIFLLLSFSCTKKLSQYQITYFEQFEACKSNQAKKCIELTNKFMKLKIPDHLLSGFKNECLEKNDSNCSYYGYDTYTYRNKEKGMKILEKSCNNNEFYSCDLLANILTKQNKLKKASDIHIRNCRNKYAHSCFKVGVYFRDIVKNLKESSLYFKKGCEFNYAASCYDLACHLSLKKDIKGSLSALEKSLVLGLNNIKMISEDKDLDLIRDTKKFKDLIKRFKE